MIKARIKFFVVMLITISIGVGIGIWQVVPPSPPSENSSDYPAYQKTLENIEKFTVEPHPTGSPEIEKVRGQIIAEIEGMGLDPIIEEHVYTTSELIDMFLVARGATREELWESDGDWFRETYGVDNIDDALAMEFPFDEDGNFTLKNIFVKLEAPDANGTILFDSHYDSVDESPGAMDCMAPVCAQLEALRSQADNTNLKTNIYFLFTDAEEIGWMGTTSFVTAHPEMKDKIDIVIGMDASGGGRVLLDTETPGYSVAKMLVKSGARPIVSSLGITVGNYMPGAPDFIVYQQHGYPGISLTATVGHETDTPADTYQNIDRATVWQFLHITLALTDYVANNSIADINNSPQEGVYFPFLPGHNILMTLPAAYALAILPCILALAWAILQITRKQFKISFGVCIMGLFMVLTIASAIFLIEGNYLFSIPLLAMVITKYIQKWKSAHMISSAVSGIIALILWTPAMYFLIAALA